MLDKGLFLKVRIYRMELKMKSRDMRIVSNSYYHMFSLLIKRGKLDIKDVHLPS